MVQFLLVIEKYRVPHSPGPVKSEERLEIALPHGTARVTALARLRLVAAALDWPVASKSDSPPILYINNDATYGIYLKEIINDETKIPDQELS